MKLNHIKRFIVLLFMTYCCGQLLVAQQANTLYFMQGVPDRGIYNPAFQSPYDFYLDIPLFPSFGLSVGNNSFVFNDAVFNRNGQTISFLHPDAMGKRADFYNTLSGTTRINGDVSFNLLGFGLRKDKNYFTFGITFKEEAGVYLPKDLFKLALYGTGEGGDNFNLKKLGVNASLYTEFALGYSRQLNDKLTVGGKLKYLAGYANVSTDFKNLELNLRNDKWAVDGSGALNASVPEAIFDRTKVFTNDPDDPARRILDFDNLGDAIRDDLGAKDFKVGDFFKNFGFGVDLGATYKVLPELQLSAAITDLGFIRWKNNTVNAEITKNYEFDGIEYIAGKTWKGKEDAGGNIIPGTSIKQELEDEGDKLKGIFSDSNVDAASGKAYSTLLSTRFNIGAEYSLLNDKIGIGLLSSNLYANKTIFPSLTISANFRPTLWFQPTLSYSILDGGFKTIGAGAQLKAGPLNFYLAVDKIPVGSKSYVKSGEIPIPQYMNGTNLYAGMTWAFGDIRKKKCFDIPKSWVVDKYGCPIDSDGDGVPDSLDECPGTPRGVDVDAVGCPIDTDGDGVPDYLDQCPDTPQGVTVDTNGCPFDTDGDGVPDYMDQCPGTPQGVAVDERGCPFDTDGDGVPDYLDQCPDTPQGVAVDGNGCPFDTDGDGIPDYMDKCPNIPGTVANNGCPELTEKDKAIFEKALYGIQFATGKATITKASYPILDAIVMIMKENSTYFLTINGHTDNVGKPASNQTLSEKRAAAVKDYLVKKGIGADRMKTQGFGDTKPLVPNTNAANKAKNRRVEFLVKYEKEVE